MKKLTTGAFLIITFSVLLGLTGNLTAFAAEYRYFVYFEGLPNNYIEAGWQGHNFFASVPINEGTEIVLFGYAKTQDGETYSCVGWKDASGSITPASGDINRVSFTLTSNASITWIYKKTYQVSFNLNAMGQHLWGWGMDDYGQVGDGSGAYLINAPARIGINDDWVLVDGGRFHSVGIRADGTLWTWGFNQTWGSLGLGHFVDQPVPAEVWPGTTWITASAGEYATLAIRADGTLWAWGLNPGQLGMNAALPMQVGLDDKWVTVSSGSGHTLAIKSDGTLWAWGLNNYGQLGVGDKETRFSLVQVTADLNGDGAPDRDWSFVSAGNYHTLALKADGSLWAWGRNREGQLGLGKIGNLIYPPNPDWLNQEFEHKATPVQVVTGGPAVWKHVSAGSDFSLAVRSDGTLWAWGNNNMGQLGIGPAPEGWLWNHNFQSEYQLLPAMDWQNAENHANQLGGYLVVTNDAAEYQWLISTFNVGNLWLGCTDVYQEGNWRWVTWEPGYLLWRRGEPNNSGNEDYAVLSTFDQRVNDVGPSPSFYSVVERKGRPSPVQVGAGSDWAAVDAGEYHSVAIKTDGTLWAWGSTTQSQVGVPGIDEGPDYPFRALTPKQVGTEGKWRLAAAGGYHSLAVRGDRIELLPHSGPRNLVEGTEITASARVMPSPDGTDIYNLTEWTAEPPMSGSAFTVASDLAFTWIYRPPHTVTIAFSQNTPQSVRNSAGAFPKEGENWFAEGSEIQIHAEPLVEDPNNPDTFYLCQGWSGEINGQAESGTSCELTISPLVQASNLTWNYARAYPLTTSYVGLPEHLRNDPRFDPRGAEAGWDPSQPVWLEEGSNQNLAPPTEIYDQGGRILYVLDLESSSGTGALDQDLDADTDNSPDTFTMSSNSSVTWVYRQKLRLRVNLGLDRSKVGDPDDGTVISAVDPTITHNGIEVTPEGLLPWDTYFAYDPDSPQAIRVTLNVMYSPGINNHTVICQGLNTISGNMPTSAPQQFEERMQVSIQMTKPTEVTWDYAGAVRWHIGQAITPPEFANGTIKPSLTLDPSITEAAAFFWDDTRKRLYPVRPLTWVVLNWTHQDSGKSDIAQPGYAVWPAAGYQSHIVGAPARLEPIGGAYRFRQLHYSEGHEDGTTGIFVQPPMDDKVFNPPGPGRSLIRLSHQATGTSLFLLVQSGRWDEAPVDEETTAIGREITSPLDQGVPFHQDPEGRNGYVFYEKSYYDGHGEERAYDRETRLGPIIPVNETSPQTDTDRQMVVVWYATGTAAGIGWPIKPVRYLCQWSDPVDGKIIIAGGNGSKPLAEYEATGRIYFQGDKDQPGYNPNEEHALLLGNKVFALRNDLNTLNEVTTSAPYVLLKYRSPDTGNWRMRVFRVEATGIDDDGRVHDFFYPIFAGQPLLPLMPMEVLPRPRESYLYAGADWHHLDHKGGHWAKAAGPASTVVMHWYYPLQAGFYYPLTKSDGTSVQAGEAVPFLNGGAGHHDLPRDVSYTVAWPDNVPVLKIGETLTQAKYGLPDIVNWAAGQVIFDENMQQGGGILARLIDPFTERSAGLEKLPDGLRTENIEGKLGFPDLPFSLRSRLFYDPIDKRLLFKGISCDSGIGEAMVLPNIMTLHEKSRLKAFEPFWQTSVEALFWETRNYMTGSQKLAGVPMALTAGAAAEEGYVVLAENDDESLGALPVALHVIRVAEGPYRGEIKVIKSDDLFDEKLTLRHSGDFGGEPEKVYFSWYYKPDNTGLPPDLPVNATDTGGWVLFAEGQGRNDITIEGAGKLTLSDNWFIVHYYFGEQPGTPGVAFPALYSEPEDPLGPLYWSGWAGSPGGETAQLAPGWIKRVVADLNPLDARVKDFRNYAVSTEVSVVSQLGERYEGDIAWSGTPENLNNLGLIETYETIMARAIDFSINASPPSNYGPVNNAILNAGTRIADFYTLLGNEAYADAQDPTIGFDTRSGALGTMASSIFAFQNQLPSLLEEELVLLRGRDDSMSTTRSRPVYNRLAWNFTRGDGELAYVQTYNIVDKNESGVVDELDAKIIFPQGHGDAWGHYLTGMKVWYSLLRHEHFTWEPRIESVLVGGAPIPVDYLDERKFAQTAAAKAKAGAEIVNLTYRKAYVEDPAAQWQGYKDDDTARAWGVDDWARRAGQGAYFDWAAANAMLPETDPVATHTGIQKIDRTTVPELQSIASAFWSIQNQADQADEGLNPLGLAKGVVPFDIDPYLLTPYPGVSTQTHFEQIYGRALTALVNARTVFDYATQYTLMLRSNDDTLVDFERGIKEQERNYRNQLIEIFGYPYQGDIGPGGTYKAGYIGPDLFHFMYVDVPDLTGEALLGEQVAYTATFDFTSPAGFDLNLDPLYKDVHQVMGPDGPRGVVTYEINTQAPWLSKPRGWGERRAPGRIQTAISQLLKAHAGYKKGLSELEGQIGGIKAAVDILEARHGVLTNQIGVLNDSNTIIDNFESNMRTMNQTRIAFETIMQTIENVCDSVVEGIPVIYGMATDAGKGAVGAIKTAMIVRGLASALNIAGVLEEEILKKEHDIAAQGRLAEKRLLIEDSRYEVQQMVKELETMEGDVRAKIQELYMLREVIHQSFGHYRAVLAEGERLISEREVFRKWAAADIQDYRYQDMSFRTFRNDAVQKYRSTFELASRYAYLAATAYDYETNLLGSAYGSGRAFLTDIVKQRSPGVIANGHPMVEKRGLADPLARLNQNFLVYKGQLGFNNPQIETNRFSLRRELFRFKEGSDLTWRAELEYYRVPDLWKFPPFKRFCRPFTDETLGAQPGIIIPFSTQVKFGQNFFGWPLGAGDSAYDPSNFATKVRSVGVWFSNYEQAGLSSTPRVYLIPVGADVLRLPSADNFAVREWYVVDQRLPVPFPVSDEELSEETWIAVYESLSDVLGGIRRFSSFRAFPDLKDLSETEIIASQSIMDTRLVGRSVWNTQWLLIIPGGTLLADADAGLDVFIDNITDIKLFFQTYSYSGN